MKHFLRRTCLLFLAIVAPLSADGLIPPLDSKQAQQARKTIEEFKTNPKGPYFQIRWFSDKTRPAQTAEDILLDLASRMDSDGGMPGENRESRASATVIALLAFLSQGHTPTRGAFRSHVGRLVSFLKSLTSLPSHEQQIVDAVIELAYKGTAPAGEWITLAHTPGNHWYEVERSVLKA